MITNDLIQKISFLVSKEIECILETQDNDEFYPEDMWDSFGRIYLATTSTKDSANWEQDLGSNFRVGREVGVRNTLKILRENPCLLNELMGDQQWKKEYR